MTPNTPISSPDHVIPAKALQAAIERWRAAAVFIRAMACAHQATEEREGGNKAKGECIWEVGDMIGSAYDNCIEELSEMINHSKPPVNPGRN